MAKMKYRQIGKSGLQVSVLGVGTMSFGNRTDESEAIEIIDAAIDAGINFFDLANVYSGGVSEEIVGKALRSNGKRAKVVITSKVSNILSSWPNDGGSSRYHIIQQCEKSLKRLKTDRIDLYMLHRMDISTPVEESMRAMDDLVKQGKVLYIGCSKFAPALMVEALSICDRYGWAKFISEHPPYNLLDRRIENEVIWTCLRHGVGILPWAPLGSGILSGRLQSKEPFPSDSAAANKVIPEIRLTKKAVEVADALKPIAEEKGVSLAEFSLAWLMQQPGVTAPLIGIRKLEHLNSALKSLDVEITQKDKERIDKIIPPGTAVSDYYDWNFCAPLRKAIGV